MVGICSGNFGLERDESLPGDLLRSALSVSGDQPHMVARVRRYSPLRSLTVCSRTTEEEWVELETSSDVPSFVFGRFSNVPEDEARPRRTGAAGKSSPPVSRNEVRPHG